MPPTLAFERIDYRVYRGPELTVEGHAARAWLRRDTGDAAAERVAVSLPARDGAPLRLEAALVEGNLRTGEALAHGGVTAEREGQRAATAAARYVPADGLVHGDQPIEILAPGLALRGPAFTFDPRAGRLRVSGGAQLGLGAAPGVGRP